MMSSSIQKLATEEADGTFTVRTEGLRQHRHAELEVVGVARPAVEPASKLIDYVIETVIEGNGAQLKDGQNVGIPLSIAGHDDVPAVFIGVHAVQSAPAEGGLFARFRNGSKGTIRLTDIVGRKGDTPVGALSTMMLYRANCRVAMGDVAAAIAELRESILVMPGDAAAGPPPAELDTDDAEFNWQNHLSYLRLADLVEDTSERARIFEQAYARFPWLAEAHFGATVAELEAVAKDGLAGEATRILAHNLAHPNVSAGPSPAMRMVASPIWTPGPDGESVRRASLLPVGFVDYYYGETLRDAATADRISSVAAEAVARFASEPWRLSEATAGARAMYGDDSSAAPIAEELGARKAPQMLLSAVMAEAARLVRAGATSDELRIAFGLSTADRSSLESKLAALEVQETDHYMQALIGP